MRIIIGRMEAHVIWRTKRDNMSASDASICPSLSKIDLELLSVLTACLIRL